MKTTSISLIGLGAILTAFSLGTVFAQSAGDSTTVVAILNKYAQAPQLSSALEEIVKLTKAGVPEPVTIAFIQNSPTAYTLNAQDVIQLQQQGVSTLVTTALMQHGEELRRAEAESSKPNQTAALAVASQPATPAVSVPTPAPGADEPVSAYPASTVSVTYFGSPSYSYAPAYCYGYGGGYYPVSYSYAPRYYGYCATRAGFGVGFGGVRYGGCYGSFGRCR
jgi:hypothetical protein